MFSSSRAFIAFAISLMAGSSSALELTTENFAEMVTGKTVFIKFYAPWCGHCKAMADDWAKLEEDFKDHKVALVGSVDCTNEGSADLCELFQVEGFPTLAWGDASAAEDYQGRRDYDSLKKFADEHITSPICSIFNLDACSDDEKAEIASVDAKSDDELIAAANHIVKLAEEADKKFQDFLDKLDKEYTEEERKHNEVLASIKKENKFKYVQQVFAKRGLSSPLHDPIQDDDDDDIPGYEF